MAERLADLIYIMVKVIFGKRDSSELMCLHVPS